MNRKESRLLPVDALRGLIMVLMALDHAAFFIAHKHGFEFWGLPLPHYQDWLSFLTRFVTHLCAPGFFFLMSVSMIFFAASRRALGWPEVKIIRHFVVRGLLLIFINQFIENPAWFLGPPVAGPRLPGGGGMPILGLGVLSGLGLAMVAGALLLRLNTAVLISLSLACVLTTQVVTPDASKIAVLYSPLTRLLFIPGHTKFIFVMYPLIPWFSFAALGLVFGKWLLQDAARAYRRAAMLGVCFLLLFLAVRALGGFGNIHPPAGPGLIHFLNVTKYPPSLAFALATMGIDLLLLAAFARAGSQLAYWGKPLLVYGRAALFFYIIHLYLYGLIGRIFAPAEGTGIAWMYPYWLAGLALLYLLCLWYGAFKQRRPPDSIWRFF